MTTERNNTNSIPTRALSARAVVSEGRVWFRLQARLFFNLLKEEFYDFD